MTDNIPGDPVEAAKRKVKKLQANGKFLIIGVLCVFLGGGSAVITSTIMSQQNTTLKTDNQSLEQQNNNIKLTVDQLNDLLGSACDSTKASEELKKYGICDVIQSIKNDPTNPVSVPGLPGVSVIRTEQNQVGHLIVFFSDGTTQDAGLVKGADGTQGTPGAPGANGKDGRSVINQAILNGELIISYSDGTAQNLGTIVGPMGPIGPKGDKGDKGDSVPQTITYKFSCNEAGFMVFTANDVPYVTPAKCDPSTFIPTQTKP